MKLANLKAIIGVSAVCLMFIIAQTSQVSAISVKELLGLKKSEPEIAENKKPTAASEQQTTNAEWSKTSEKEAGSNPQINLDYVSLLIANMNQQEREKILADQTLFKQIIENEANNRSAVSAAIVNNLVEDRNVEFLMRRGAENILRESYLNRLISSKLPKDFPSDDQVSEYYDSNKDQFIVPERIHAWQIFFKKPEAANKKDLAALTKRAEDIISALKKGKMDYSNIALSQSEHEQSKALGGYMGLLKTADLIPAIKDPILKLKEGEISQPVESEAGIHILKRGKILKSESLNLPQVEQQIRQLLIKQANLQLRNAIFTQARKEYPQAISDNKLEEWRLRLRTNTNQ
jgi:parvulin-like peptidyl-prolyl isomerase